MDLTQLVVGSRNFNLVKSRYQHFCVYVRTCGRRRRRMSIKSLFESVCQQFCLCSSFATWFESSDLFAFIYWSPVLTEFYSHFCWVRRIWFYWTSFPKTSTFSYEILGFLQTWYLEKKMKEDSATLPVFYAHRALFFLYWAFTSAVSTL